MARARRSRSSSASGSGKLYAWSDLYLGGESTETRLGRKIIHSREIIRRGEEVERGLLDVTDEEFAHLVATGSIRNYPLPEGYEGDAAEGQSPVTFVQEALKTQLEAIEEGSAAMTAEDMLVRASVVGTQIFGQSPEEVFAEVALPDGVEEVETETETET